MDSLIKKAARKIYFLMQRKRARVPAEDLVAFYCACIRSSLDYACPVFHYSLPQYLQSELESVQKRALPYIFSWNTVQGKVRARLLDLYQGTPRRHYKVVV